MTQLHKTLAGAAGALTLLVSASVMAAPHGRGCGDDGHGHGHGKMRGEHMGGERGGPGAVSAQHLQRMKMRLQITPQQEAAWTAFATQATEQAAKMRGLMAPPPAAGQDAAKPLPAPERMARHTELMSQRLAGMQAVNAAFKDLYAQLTPEQKALADQGMGRMQRGQRGDGPQGDDGRRGHRHG